MGDEQNDEQLGLSVNFVHKNTSRNVTSEQYQNANNICK